MPATGLPVASITTSTRLSWQTSPPSAVKCVSAMRAESQPDSLARTLGAFRIEIGDYRDLEAADRRHLRQKHRAEFSSTDQSDADRLVRIDPGGEERLQVQDLFRRNTMTARILQQCVIRHRNDRREIAVRYPFGPCELGNVVGTGAQRQIDDLARIGRNIRR